MKKIIIFVMTAIMVAALALPAFAKDENSSSVKRVVDQADILSVTEEADLTVQLEELANKYKIDTVVVTTTDIELSDLSDYDFNRALMNYADDYYDYNGYADDGFLLLLAFDGDERGFWISTKGKCINYFTVDDINDIMNDYGYDTRVANIGFYKSISNSVDGCRRVIKNYKSLSPMVYIAAVVVGLIVMFVVSGKMVNKLKSVRSKPAASEYIKKDTLNITRANDVFLYRNVSRVKIERSSSSGGSHGTHTSSSGSSHGGGGGRV